eukprot:1078118-Alexandrium_andersonii.AAC.1
MQKLVQRGSSNYDVWAGIDSPRGRSSDQPTGEPPALLRNIAAELKPGGKKNKKTYVINIVVCAGTLQTCLRPLVLVYTYYAGKKKVPTDNSVGGHMFPKE